MMGRAEDGALDGDGEVMGTAETVVVVGIPVVPKEQREVIVKSDIH